MLENNSNNKALRFLSAEGGAVLIETILWLPFVFLLCIAIGDTFIVYMNHARTSMVLEDTTRSLVVGELADCDAFVTTIEARLQPTIPSAAATCRLDGEQTVVNLTLPASEMGIGAISGFIDSFTMTASVLRTLEYVGPTGGGAGA